jgi:hypothetical protein
MPLVFIAGAEFPTSSPSATHGPSFLRSSPCGEAPKSNPLSLTMPSDLKTVDYSSVPAKIQSLTYVAFLRGGLERLFDLIFFLVISFYIIAKSGF